MPAYVWSCLACGNSNAASARTCDECHCPAAATVADIEIAQATNGRNAAVQEKVAESCAHRQEAFAVALTFVALTASWAGSRLFHHFENWLFVVAGVVLLLLASVLWRLRA